MEKVGHDQFLYLEQSQGGIFKVPFWGANGTKTYSIGSDECWNCVCVYVPLDKDFCFAAHIDAWAFFGKEDGSAMVPPKGSEESLKDAVKRMLKQEIQSYIPKGGLAKEWNERAIMLNLRPMVALNGVSTKATGFYIAEAIMEFFGLLGSTDDQHTFGFVVNHITSKREYFRWDKNVKAPTAQDLDRYEAYELDYPEGSHESVEESKARQYPADHRKLSSGRSKDWKFHYHNSGWYSKADMETMRVYGRK